MALATIFMQQWNGASGAELATAKNAEAVQFKSADNAAVELPESATSPLKAPRAGVYRSQEIWLRPYLGNLGAAAQVSNLTAHVSSPNLPAGMFIRYKVEAAYATPAPGGYEAGGAMVDADGDFMATTSANPIDLGAGPFNVVGDIGDFLVLQIEGLANVPQGLLSGLDLVLSWDEA